MIELRVYGRPAPQGSKERRGHGAVVESSKYVKPWRADVRRAAEELAACDCPEQCGGLAPGYPLDGPLFAFMVFTFTRPKSHYRTGRNSHLLREGAPARPQGTPDLSKLIRSTEDALTSAGLWKDDARVVEYVRTAKVWTGEDPDALDAPGALIRVWPLEDAEAEAWAALDEAMRPVLAEAFAAQFPAQDQLALPEPTKEKSE